MTGATRLFIPAWVVLLWSLLSSVSLFAQPWQFAKEKNGIKVYTRQEAGKAVKSFRGEAVLQTTVDKVYAIIGSVRSTDKWDPSIRELKVLASVKDKTFSYYLIYGVPWPLHDRDLCVEATITHDTVTGEVVILSRSRPELVPEMENLVRIKNYWQKWIIQPLDKTHLKLILEGFADPAGSLPAWLINMVITDTPLNLMQDIQKKVE